MMKKLLKKQMTFILGILLFLQTIFPFFKPLNLHAEDPASTIFTDYFPEITEVINQNSGFKHPGIGLTKELLDNIREKIRSGIDPWKTYFNAMLKSSAASLTVTSSNQVSSDSSTPSTVAFNSQGVNSKFIADALKAYTQAILYYVTGNETYRSNAMHIIRIWSNMDPTQYVYFTDAHIHTGIPLNRMVTAAEILRYSSCQNPSLIWTEADTVAFTNNLIIPVIETFQSSQNRFMNQHNYSIIGATAGYLFMDDFNGYCKEVEWFTVNSSASDQGFNGSIKQLFRWVYTDAVIGELVPDENEENAPNGHVQHVEMGRDQAHGGGDLTNSVIISRMLIAQGTKVDPENGTVSTSPNAVGPYEFLNNRILAAADYFWRYMLGYDTPWTKVAYSISSDGIVRDTYNYLSPSYRGRFNTANFWDLYSYYTYKKGQDVSQIAPYYYEAFTKKLPSNYYYGGSLTINWDNVDGGGDFWLYLPEEAENNANIFLAKEQTSPYIIEIEDRFTQFDSNTSIKIDSDGTSYVRFNTTESGSKIALLNASTSNKTVGFKIRTNGDVILNLKPGINDNILIPNTNGQWRYVTYTMNSLQSLGDILYITAIGDGATIDIDHLNVNAGTLLTPPSFTKFSSTDDINIVAYIGAVINLDFSATDSGATDVLSYSSFDIPNNAQLNVSTGAFSWTPTEIGTFSFIISVSDQTTITAKKVTIQIKADRYSALAAAIASYNSDKIYTKASLSNYQAVYNQTVALIENSTEEVFTQQLINLCSATHELKLVSPTLELDGSLAYQKIVSYSTFGTSIANLVDNNPGTSIGYSLALGTAPYKYHIIDFGVNYTVSAASFGFQSNIFADRLAGCAVFGSNDGNTWTRLTSGLTSFTQDFQILEVDDAYKNSKFRFLKVQMLINYPDILHNTTQGLLEISEFRIYGQCYETGNVINNVSITSNCTDGRTIEGNTVTLTFTATEEISNVSVSFENENFVTPSYDGTKYTATWTIDGDDSYDAGKLANFKINYTKVSDNSSHTIFETTDGTSVFLSSNQNLINCNGVTYIDSTSGRTAATTATNVGYLFDSNPSTFSDFRLNGSGSGSYIIFDFYGANKIVKLSRVEILARQDSYYTRISGTYIQGSNDGVTWTTLSTANASSQKNWQTINILTAQQNVYYRYIKVINNSAWYGNIAELRLLGEYTELPNAIANITITSDSNSNRVAEGNKITLTFNISQSIENPVVTFENIKQIIPTTINGTTYIAEWIIDANDSYTPGKQLEFLINYSVGGIKAVPKSTTTDGTSIFLSSNQNLINCNEATYIDSTSGRTAATTATNVGYLFDSNPSTFSDFRLNGSGSGSYIIFDFYGANKIVKLSRVEILARQDSYYTRISGTYIQGSNDGVTWTTLSTANASSQKNWQTINILTAQQNVYYRYIKVINNSAWYGNIAELRLLGNSTTVGTLLSIIQPSNIDGIANGTDKTSSALGLPTKVTLVTDSGNVQANVSWNVENSSYNPNLATSQTFTVEGTVNLPDGVVNTNNVPLTVSINVTVAEAISTDKILLSIIQPSDIDGIANGTDKTSSALGLPTKVTLVTDSGNVQANVSWNVENSSYNPNLATSQTFTVEGTVNLPDGVVNTNNVPLTVRVHITVKAKNISGNQTNDNFSDDSLSFSTTVKNDALIEVTKIPQWIKNSEVIKIEADDDTFEQSVEIQLTENSQTKAIIEQALAGKMNDVTKFFPIDISIYIKNTNIKVQPKNDKMITITCPIPEELLSYKENITVVCVIDGVLKVLHTELLNKNGVWCVVFKTNHFSPYAFVVDSNGNLSSLAAGAENYDNTIIISENKSTYMSIFTSIALSIILLRYLRNKNKNL
jgi:hypothetical protein